jgi:hypothetical protein
VLAYKRFNENELIYKALYACVSKPENMVISILGCGWFGLPLQDLINERYHVNGSTTSYEKLPVLKKKKLCLSDWAF